MTEELNLLFYLNFNINSYTWVLANTSDGTGLEKNFFHSFIHLFMYGCIGSLLLRAGFL